MLVPTTKLPLFDQSPDTNTSVRRQETNGRTRPSPSCRPPQRDRPTPTSFRHSGWAADRERVLAALKDSGQTESRIKRFYQCGLTTWVYRHKTHPNRFRLVGGYCHDRFCVPCQRAKAALVCDNLVPRLAGKRIRHVVLTLRHTDDDLPSLIDFLLRCFATLRRTRFWRHHVRGGAAFFELKHNDVSHTWHPHLHILCEGRFIPQGELSLLWKNITHGSFVVYITPVPSQSQVARYVTKYASKGVTHAVNHRPDLLQQCIVALAGRRTCMTIGSWRGYALLDTHPSDEWVPVNSFWNLMHLADDGDKEARSILDSIYAAPPPDLIDQPIPPHT